MLLAFSLILDPPASQRARSYPPEPTKSRKVCAVMWCSLASESETSAALAPLLAVGSPLLHGVGPVPFPALQSLFDGLYTPGLQWYWRADFVRTLPEAAIEQHLAFAERLPTLHSTMHLYPIDGAVHDVGERETPFAYRDAQWAEVIVGVDPDPAKAARIRDWTIDYWDATHPFAEAGAYVNFMMDEGQERVQATYRGNYERPTQIKATYDPKNVFRVNQNIRPATPTDRPVAAQDGATERDGRFCDGPARGRTDTREQPEPTRLGRPSLGRTAPERRHPRPLLRRMTLTSGCQAPRVNGHAGYVSRFADSPEVRDTGR
jgi:hypothetical protein